MKLRWSFLFLLFLLPLTSQAEIFAESSGISGNRYFGINLSALRYQEGDADAHEPAIGARYGYSFSDYLAVEGHVAAGLENDVIQDDNVVVGVDYLAGIYVRGNLFLWDPRARLYGLIGITHGKITIEAFNVEDKTTDTELSFGVGFELYGDSRNALNIEAMRYLDGEKDDASYEVDAFTLGYTHRF
jgi:hypothetical protein